MLAAAAAHVAARSRTLQPLSGICSRLLPPCQLSTHIGTSNPAPKSLDDIMKLEQLRSATPEEVEQIWMKFHLSDSQGRAGAVLPAPMYKTFMARARAAPNFVLPLGKGDGKSLTVLLQCQLPHVLYTGLEDFKQMGASAPPVLTVTHYPELQDSHGLVLTRGDVVSPHVVSVPEARTLMALTHAFYMDPTSFLRVNQFNHEPEQFSYEDMLQHLGHTVPS